VPFPRLLFLLASLLVFTRLAGAKEFRANDVVSFVGGEDMVVAAEDGYFELDLALLHPEWHLKFRSLAKEGDTVFEQHRDLNYPPLEEQLSTTGTTLIIAEFGLMEALAKPNDPDGFIAAYEALLDRLSPGGSRRLMLIARGAFAPQIAELAQRRHAQVVTFPEDGSYLRDGVHLNAPGQFELAHRAIIPAGDMAGPVEDAVRRLETIPLLAAIREKNRLWFYYYRPQNWAFLAGDRTNQPSSRDYKDPSIRWFPKEMEEFLPLIAAKETEIAQLAAKQPRK
jgi:hypothetical protein